MDRTTQILQSLSTQSPLPPEFVRQTPTQTIEELEAELSNHPFFMKSEEIDEANLPPLLSALQQLKYSPDENTPNELALQYKEDGLFHFKLGKYRIAATLFTEALKYAEDEELKGVLHNNRGVSMWYIGNIRSASRDLKLALKHKPNYPKAAKKLIECYIQLKNWDDASETLKNFSSEPWSEELKKNLKKSMKNSSIEQYQEKQKKLKQHKEELLIISRLKGAGVKLGGDSVPETAKISVVEDGLTFPVLILYPEYSTSDFIEAFEWGGSFTPHLQELLDSSPPPWDRNSHYKSTTVSLYYITSDAKKVKIDNNSTLLEVLRKKDFLLPPNFTPGFLCLSNISPFSQFFLERLD